jgi:general secretion pathway protein N
MLSNVVDPVRIAHPTAVAAICFVIALIGAGMRVSAASLEGPDSAALDGRAIDGAARGLAIVSRAAPQPDPLLRRRPSNPLDQIRLDTLTATTDRPLFSSSRRPPPRAVATAVIEPVQPAPPPPREPERPPLALIGSIVGKGDAIALVLDQTTNQVQLLRRGDSHAGWTLNAVQPREVTLSRNAQTEVLVLSSTAVAPNEATAIPGETVPGVPVAGAGTSYAPFIPRSTPKNGESDGL